MAAKQQALPRRYSEIAFVVALLLFAAALRIPGITYGAPDRQYYPSYASRQLVHDQLPIQPDEYEFVAIGLEMVVARSVKLPYVNRTLQVLVNALTYWLTGAASDITPALREGVNSRSYAPFPLYVIARTYSALASVFVVAGVYALARMLGGRFAALSAGLTAAVSMTAVQHAHYATTSSAAAAFAVLSVWASFRALSGKPRAERWLLLAGLAAGFAGGNRYNAAAVSLVVFFTGLVLLYRDTSWRMAKRVLPGWLMFPAGIVISIPQLIGITSFQQTVEHFLYAVRQYSVGLESSITTPYGLLFELRHMLVFSTGPGAALIALIGLVVLLRAAPGRPHWLRRTTPFLMLVLLLTYLIPYTVVVLRTIRPGGADQLLLPFIPFVAVLAGVGAGWIARRLALPARLLQPALILALIVLPLVLSIQTVRMFNQRDTRYRMLEWVYEHVPRGTLIYLYGPYNVPLDAADYPSIQVFEQRTMPGPADIRASGAALMLRSDAYTFDLLRSWEIVPLERRQQLTATLEALDAAFPIVAHIPRPEWTGYEWFTNTASYWHHPGLTLYCVTPEACAAYLPAP